MAHFDRQCRFIAKDVEEKLSKPIPAHLEPLLPISPIDIFNSLSILLSTDRRAANPFLPRVLRVNWDKVCRWASLFLRTYAFLDVPKDRFQQLVSIANEILMAPSNSTLKLVQPPDRHHIYDAAPDLLPILVRFCVHLNARQDIQFAFLFMRLAKIMPKEDIVASLATIEEYDVPLNAVRYLISLNQIPLQGWKIPFEPLAFSESLHLIHLLISSKRPEFCRVLLKNNLPAWVARTMCFLALTSGRSSRLNIDIQGLFSSLYFCCQIARECWAYGHTGVVESLDNRMIHAMWKTMSGADDELLNEYARTIVALEPFLVYRSVVLRCLRKLQGVLKQGMAIEMPNSDQKDHPFLQVAQSVATEAEKFAESIHDFEREVGCISRYCPHRMTPDAYYNRIKYRKCSQCQIGVYCTIECQKADWDTGHSIKCKELAKRIGEPSTYDEELIKYHTMRRISGIINRIMADKAKLEIGPDPRQDVVVACVVPGLAKEISENLGKMKCAHGEDKKQQFLAEWEKVDVQQEILVVAAYHGPGCHAMLVYRAKVVDQKEE
ncbi:hypothetical protein VNI00_009403 [Paramarasmius palmivorus]|uniref:MYND-type domain-containing protein n=1 Tax=Paramarasmius palmivorus TaxID=297713 RepID=A0AAW0CR62_9AGAR